MNLDWFFCVLLVDDIVDGNKGVFMSIFFPYALLKPLKDLLCRSWTVLFFFNIAFLPNHLSFQNQRVVEDVVEDGEFEGKKRDE